MLRPNNLGAVVGAVLEATPDNLVFQVSSFYYHKQEGPLLNEKPRVDSATKKLCPRARENYPANAHAPAIFFAHCC